MNIIDALKSGRRVRRKNTVWHHPVLIYYTEEILADDWEVEEEKFEVTETQIRKAVRKWWKEANPQKGENAEEQLLRLLKEEIK